MSETTSRPVEPDELAALRAVALHGVASDGDRTGLGAAIKLSCADLAERLDASNQTASRRLRRLESAGLVTRETVSDGQWIEITADGRRALRGEYETYRRLFEDAAVVELTGAVTSGMGEGRHYVTLEGYMEQFVDRLGYEPYPGTLNVELTDGSVRHRTALDAFDPVPIDGWEDGDRTYGPAVCYPATVEAADGELYENAHTIAPERTHHDDDQLELIAPDRLRDALDLDDSDRITVHVQER